MAESKSVSVYLPEWNQAELNDLMEKDGYSNTSQYLKDVIHLVHMAGGKKALEQRLLSG